MMPTKRNQKQEKYYGLMVHDINAHGTKDRKKYVKHITA